MKVLHRYQSSTLNYSLHDFRLSLCNITSLAKGFQPVRLVGDSKETTEAWCVEDSALFIGKVQKHKPSSSISTSQSQHSKKVTLFTGFNQAATSAGGE